MNSTIHNPVSAGASLTKIPPADIIFGPSIAMTRLREVVDRIALAPTSVFIHGATGAGKEVLAKYIHQCSPWGQGPLIKVSCAAIPRALLEAEMFGIEKGAFTNGCTAKPGLVELSDSGTLLLDDISTLDLGLQGKLLHFLQHGTFTRIGGCEQRRVATRVISTANPSLEEEAKQGKLREDLMHRISGVTLGMPPLRERIEDLPYIAHYLLSEFEKEFETQRPPLSATLGRRLLRHPWPGNIRELENVLRRYALLGTPEAIIEGLNLRSSPSATLHEIDATDSPLKTHTRRLIQQAEALAILEVLQQHGWDRAKSAESLKISVRGLLYKMRNSGISIHAPEKSASKPKS